MLEQLVEIFGETIVLSESLSVSAEVFAELFVSCSGLTYAELKRVDEEKGYCYSPYIEYWKEQGLIE